MKIGILSSGGDCPGINATIRGVGKTAIMHYGMEVIGIHSGFIGLLNKDVQVFDERSLSGILNLGGTILGTSREKPFRKLLASGDSEKPEIIKKNYEELGLDCFLHNPAIANSNVHFIKEDSYDFHLENTLDMKVLMKKFKLGSKAPQSVSLNVSNVDRAFGAIFGSEITRKYGNDLPDDVYTVHCTGAGGQSFGAFIPSGLTLELVGDCNDYMGKGLSGGKIVVRPPQGIDFKPEENIITGNVALYGATSGKAFISGVAGERFCVRNSGATAVVEGVGDHGCEYMTGGTVVVLGQTGKNFAAGMTGGIAYVLDENWDFYQRVNKETVSLEPVEHKYDVATLKELIRAHVEATGSPRGKEILDNFSAFLPKFKKVLPYDYDRMLRVIASVEERGLDGEQAQIEAFYAVQKHK